MPLPLAFDAFSGTCYGITRYRILTCSGGKKFSRDLQPLDKDGNPMGMWRDPADKIDESEEESSEEESSEESSEDEGSASKPAAEQDLTREQRKELARKRKAAAVARKNKKIPEAGDLPTSSEEESEDDDMPANPNHTQKARNQARAVTGASGEEPKKPKQGENMSRREKEALAAEAARERYQKLHAEGKTDEARADLARLKLIKEQREAAAARKKAEQEEKDAQQAANKERLEREQKKREAALGPSAKKGAKSKK